MTLEEAKKEGMFDYEERVAHMVQKRLEEVAAYVPPDTTDLQAAYNAAAQEHQAYVQHCKQNIGTMSDADKVVAKDRLLGLQRKMMNARTLLQKAQQPAPQPYTDKEIAALLQSAKKICKPVAFEASEDMVLAALPYILEWMLVIKQVMGEVRPDGTYLRVLGMDARGKHAHLSIRMGEDGGAYICPGSVQYTLSSEVFVWGPREVQDTRDGITAALATKG